MPREWDLVRVGKGSSGKKANSEVRIMRHQQKNGCRGFRIAIRFSGPCMKLQRWFPGDMLYAKLSMSDDGKRLTAFVSRTDDDQKGIKLTSNNTKSGSATVQFAALREMIDAIFTGDRTGIDGRIETASTDNKTAVFVFDLV